MRRLGRFWRGRPTLTALATLDNPAARLLFEGDGVARLVVDRAGRLLRATEGVAALLGPGAGARADLAALFVPDPAAVLAAALEGCAAALELRARHDDGSLVPLRVRVLPVRDPEGAAEGAVLLLADARPVALREAGQAHALRLQSIGELAGGVAHDFNNMLLAVLGAADSLHERPELSAAAREEVGLVLDGARRGTRLVAQLLAFARRQALQPRLVVVNAAVTEIAPLLRHSLGERVRLRLELEEPGRTVRIDPGQFDQVLVNLAVNARDAMPQGGTVTIRTGRVVALAPREGGLETVPPGRYVALEVRDTGTGIPPDVLPRIFEPFFTTRGPRGTGLGLATVLGIVRQSGGYLEVETWPGQGTLFRILLPRAQEEAGLAPAPAPSPGPAQSPSPDPAAARGRILLAEDEEPVRRLAVRRLSAQGWNVLAAGSGEEALALLDEGGVDAVVTDMVMPGIDGVALVEEVRRRLGRPDLPALITSGYADVALHDAMAAAATAFLPKPYALRDLTDRVATLVPAPKAEAKA